MPQPKDLYNAARTLLTLTSVELVNELYCQLLKQTHRQSREHLAYWHVLATVIPFITPKGNDMLSLVVLSGRELCSVSLSLLQSRTYV